MALSASERQRTRALYLGPSLALRRGGDGGTLAKAMIERRLRRMSGPLPTLLFLSACSSASVNAPTAPPVASPGPVPVAQAPTEPLRLYSQLGALLPVGVTSFGAAATAEHLYTLGGYFGRAHEYSREGQSDAFQRMDFATGTWASLPGVGPVQSATLTEFEGKLYRVGGLLIHNAKGEPEALESVATVQRFDPALGTWETLPSLPAPRSSHEVVLVGPRLYVVGGWRLSGGSGSGQWDDEMYVADLRSPELRWERLPASLRLRALGVASLGERIVTIGGIDKNAASEAVHVYDPHSGSWSAGPNYPEPGFGVRAVELGGTVVASGVSGKVYALDLPNERWLEVSTLTFPRAFHQVVRGPNHTALVLGGIPGMRRVDRVRHIEVLSATPPASAVTRFELDAAGSAKNRQGLFLREDQLYLFGGNKSLGQHDFAPENFLVEGHRLDLGSLQWKPLVPFPVPQQSMQTTITSQGFGVAVGGFGADEQGQKTRRDVYRFDFAEETWQRAAAGLPESRTQFGLVEHGDKLWLFGGLDFDDERKGRERFEHPLSVLTAEVKDLDRGFGDSGVRIPRPRRAHAAELLDGRYYLVGGMAAGFAPVKECDVFTFETSTWSTIACPSRQRIGAEMVALGGKLYLAAGRAYGADGKLGPDSSIEVFDPATGQWSLWLEGLPLTDSHQLRMLPFGERLLVYTAQRPDAKVELLFVDPTLPRSESATPSTP